MLGDCVVGVISYRTGALGRREDTNIDCSVCAYGHEHVLFWALQFEPESLELAGERGIHDVGGGRACGEERAARIDCFANEWDQAGWHLDACQRLGQCLGSGNALAIRICLGGRVVDWIDAVSAF